LSYLPLPDADAVAKRAEHWESNASLRSRFLVDKISSMFIALTWTASALLRMAESSRSHPSGSSVIWLIAVVSKIARGIGANVGSFRF
jgi:hypothetical protein